MWSRSEGLGGKRFWRCFWRFAEIQVWPQLTLKILEVEMIPWNCLALSWEGLRGEYPKAKSSLPCWARGFCYLRTTRRAENTTLLQKGGSLGIRSSLPCYKNTPGSLKQYFSSPSESCPPNAAVAAPWALALTLLLVWRFLCLLTCGGRSPLA